MTVLYFGISSNIASIVGIARIGASLGVSCEYWHTTKAPGADGYAAARDAIRRHVEHLITRLQNR